MFWYQVHFSDCLWTVGEKWLPERNQSSTGACSKQCIMGPHMFVTIQYHDSASANDLCWISLISIMQNSWAFSVFLQMKSNPVQDRSPVHGDDYVILPEPRTAINICSKETMNITISQCSLNVFQNLAKVQYITTAAMSSPRHKVMCVYALLTWM